MPERSGRRPRPTEPGEPRVRPNPSRRGTPSSPEAKPEADSEPERLQRTLARAGFGSRRAAEDLIRQGRVTVRGRVATLGDRVDPRRDSVAVDGLPIPAHPELRYFALHKPAGVTTTLRDPHAARTVAAFLPSGPRVFPVGRLDRETEGLLLLTNDGTLSHRLQHPRFGVDREYLVEVPGTVSRADLRRLTAGVELEDGTSRAVRAREVERTRGRTAVAVVMQEGRKREVRRMFDALGHPVDRLVRVRVGPVRLGRLAPGKVRPLTRDEVAALYRSAGLALASPRSRATTRRASAKPRRKAST
jgi:23S rRNA pseudouridine2605 synthase